MLCARFVHFCYVLMSRSAGLCNSPPSRQAIEMDPAAAASFALTELPQLLLLCELFLGELCHPTPGRVPISEAHSDI